MIDARTDFGFLCSLLRPRNYKATILELGGQQIESPRFGTSEEMCSWISARRTPHNASSTVEVNYIERERRN